MTTSLADLLAALTDSIDPPAPHHAGPALLGRHQAGIRAAFDHLARAFTVLCRDGVSRHLGGLRETALSELARACRAVAATGPQHATRTAELAGALADAITVSGFRTTLDQRWAVTGTLVDVLPALTDVLAIPSAPTPPALEHRLTDLDRRTCALEQLTSAHPPARTDYAVLHELIPAGESDAAPKEPAATLRSAVATLTAMTRPTGFRPAPQLSVADVLAVTIAAHTVCVAAAGLPADRPAAPADATLAALGWQRVQHSLAPFNDGSRRPQRDLPDVVRAAHALHSAAHAAAAAAGEVPVRTARAAFADVLTHLPILAAHLEHTITRWPNTRAVVAYAVHLPARESRVRAGVAGTTVHGIVAIDHLDLEATIQALRDAALVSARAAETEHPRRTSTPARSADQLAQNERTHEKTPAPPAGPDAARQRSADTIARLNRDMSRDRAHRRIRHPVVHPHTPPR